MKYLAAYALLALGGNNNISTFLIIKPLQTLRECWEMLRSMPMMPISTDLSNLSRVRPSIN